MSWCIVWGLVLVGNPSPVSSTGTCQRDPPTGIHLRSIGSSGNVTFDVADTAADVDLSVTASLLDPVQVTYLGYNAKGTTAGIVKNGAGKMSLTGANTYSGGTTLNAGTLVAGSSGAFGSGAITLSGGTLDVNGQTLTNAITASGGSVAGAGTLSGAITGSGSLTKAGNGALVLGGTNGFSGGLVVSGGSLSGTSSAAFGTGAIAVNGGTVDLGGYTLGNAITLSGGSLAGTSGLTGSLSFSNVTLTFSGLTAFGSAGINVGSGATLDLNFLNPTNTITLSGGELVNYANWTGPVALAGTVDASLINSLTSNTVTVGAGANVDLTGVSKDIVYTGGALNNLSGYTGTLTVRGSLDLTGGVPASTGTVRVESGSVDFGNGNFAGTVQYVGGAIANYAGAVNVTGTNVALTAANLSGASLVLTAGNTATIGAGLQADLRLEGGSLSAGSLNNLTGTVTVAGNQLLDLGGSPGSYAISNAGMNIVVESGATLKGTASVGAITAQAGSILAPGNSPGQILADSLKPLAGSVYDFEIRTIVDGVGIPGVAGFDYDTITVAGELDLTGLSVSSQLLLNLITLDMFNTNSTAEGWDPATAFELTLYSYGTLKLNEGATLSELFNINSDGFLDASFASVFNGHFSVVNDTLNKEIHLVYSTTAIPEPSTYGLMLGGLALAAAACRRKRRKEQDSK